MEIQSLLSLVVFFLSEDENVPTWLNLIHQPSHVSVWRGKKRILFMGPPPPRWFPSGRWRRPCEVNTDSVYFPELCKPSVARHKVKVKGLNLLYRLTQLSAAIPHIWRLPVSDTEIRQSRAHATRRIVLHIQISLEYESWLWQMSRQ